MPEVHLETLVCGGSINDSKIASAADDSPPPIPTDFPAESYYVSKEDEFDWFDRNALYERKGSTKGTVDTISKRYVLNQKPKTKSKASIIGLPKTQKTNFLDGKVRRNPKPASARFFPKRSRSTGKSNFMSSEPTSPKVSCIGRVRSKRDRRRRLKLKEEMIPPPPVSRPGKHRLWTTLKAVLKLGRRKTNQSSGGDEKKITRVKSLPKKYNHNVNVNPPVAELSGLAGLKRFSSGRRADSWGGGSGSEVDPFESPDDKVAPVWRRRGVGPTLEVECDRQWEYVGPASV